MRCGRLRPKSQSESSKVKDSPQPQGPWEYSPSFHLVAPASAGYAPSGFKKAGRPSAPPTLSSSAPFPKGRESSHSLRVTNISPGQPLGSVLSAVLCFFPSMVCLLCVQTVSSVDIEVSNPAKAPFPPGTVPSTLLGRPGGVVTDPGPWGQVLCCHLPAGWPRACSLASLSLRIL